MIKFFIYLITLFFITLIIACGDNNSNDTNPPADVYYYNCRVDEENTITRTVRWCVEETDSNKYYLSVFNGGTNSRGSQLFHLTTSNDPKNLNDYTGIYEDSGTLGKVTGIRVNRFDSVSEYMRWSVKRQKFLSCPIYDNICNESINRVEIKKTMT